jgi:hypothetical protein
MIPVQTSFYYYNLNKGAKSTVVIRNSIYDVFIMVHNDLYMRCTIQLSFLNPTRLKMSIMTIFFVLFRLRSEAQLLRESWAELEWREEAPW